MEESRSHRPLWHAFYHGTLKDFEDCVTHHPDELMQPRMAWNDEVEEDGEEPSGGQLLLHHCLRRWHGRRCCHSGLSSTPAFSGPGVPVSLLEKVHCMVRVRPELRLMQDEGTAASGESGSGDLPLHILLQQANSLLEPSSLASSLRSILLTDCLESASVKNKDGATPFTIAIRYGQDDVVRDLLDRHVQEGRPLDGTVWRDLMENDDDDYGEEHDSNGGRSMEGLLRRLVAADGAGTVELDDQHGRALWGHALALETRHAKRMVQCLMAAIPAAVTTVVDAGTGNLPLHEEAQGLGRYEFVQLLRDAYPGGVCVRNKDGQLPIHVALMNERSNPYVLDLLAGSESSFDGFTTADRSKLVECVFQSWIRRRFAKQPRMDDTITITKEDDYCLQRLRWLFQTRPSLVQEGNDLGQLPLHMACMYHMPPSVVDFLVQVYPKAVETLDADGLLPLHRACTMSHQPCHPLSFAEWTRRIATLQVGPTLPVTRDGVPALVVAACAEGGGGVDVVFALLQRSCELFPHRSVV